MSEFVVAIPSHRREGRIADLTLDFLARNGVRGEQVYIFVSSEEERDRYETALADAKGRYNRVVVAEPGLARTLNVMIRHFPEGTRVLRCDDDITDLVILAGAKRGRPLREGELVALIGAGFAACLAKGTKLWGVYPSANPYFMYDTVTTDLRFLIGAFLGIIVDHDPTLLVSEIATPKEDYERTIKHYLKFGAVVRFNSVGIKTRIYTEPGGLQAGQRTPATVARAAAYLLATYPNLVRRSPNRKNRDEILLNRRATR